MEAYELAEVPFNDLKAQEAACKEYFDKVINTKHRMLHQEIGHSSFKNYLKIVNSRQDYQTLLKVMEDPDFFFENPLIYRFTLTKFRRSI